MGVMHASGFIIGESLMDVAVAEIISGTGRADALALARLGFAGKATVPGAIAFVEVCAWFPRAAGGGRAIGAAHGCAAD